MKSARSKIVCLASALLFALPALAGPQEALGPRAPEETLQSLEVAEGLAARVFASEPMVRNPAVIDIDSRGRVWAAEGINYRRWKDLQPEGDRIVILEDTDSDGKADTSKTYYQGPEIDNALGLCVLGNKLIVSRSPDVFVFTDEDCDDKPDKIEKLFTGVSGEQHDHGIHSFVFGPDGKVYFNMGNEGHQILDKDGKPIVDKAGNLIQDEVYPYREGMVFRCNLDGSEVETMAWNFRNNYEIAVDSFGTMWQSDNDDDGNRGVRINYVMQYGNYGYRDEITGANWRDDRPNLETEIPLQHWHLNDPGVVPNLLQTGAGSPTGIVVYEGDLLPPVFRGQMIHCDAGPNVVRAYPVEPDGAGYKAKIVNVLHSEKDTWFRPADVCVAPDGSLMVADWYDPGVGGHQMGDHNLGSIRGRIYRVAPKIDSYTVPGPSFETAESCAQALLSPNQATRYLAWTRLHEMGPGAEAALKEIWNGKNPRHRARALQLLARIEGRQDHYLDQAAQDPDPNLRITALRIASETGRSLVPLLQKLANDLSPQVRRECALSLRHCNAKEALQIWAQLAQGYSHGDRWYLEALGIGADHQETPFLQAWLDAVDGEWKTDSGRDIVWRSRSPLTNHLLVDLIEASDTAYPEAARYIRALHFTPRDGRDRAFERLLEHSIKEAKSSDKWASIGIDLLVLSPDFHFVPERIPEPYVQTLLDAAKGTHHFVTLVETFDIKTRGADLLEFVLAAPSSEEAADAAKRLLGDQDSALVRATLFGEENEKAARLIETFGYVGNAAARNLAQQALLTDPLDPSVYRAAVNALARSQEGARIVLDLAKDNQLPPSARGIASLRLNSVHESWSDIRKEAAEMLPLPTTKEGATVPELNELTAVTASIENGEKVYTALCLQCHKIHDKGTDFGPELSEIGSKLGKDALYQSIVDPSAGISFGYETHRVDLASGTTTLGYVVSQTDDTLVLKETGGIENTYPQSDVLNDVIQKTSLMPEGLTMGMTKQEFADLLEFLSNLKTKVSE